jgi:hypothetical protein
MAQRDQRGMTTVRAPRILTITPQLDSAVGSLSLRLFGWRGTTRGDIERLVVSRGTDGSNPVPSTDESGRTRFSGPDPIDDGGPRRGDPQALAADIVAALKKAGYCITPEDTTLGSQPFDELTPDMRPPPNAAHAAQSELRRRLMNRAARRKCPCRGGRRSGRSAPDPCRRQKERAVCSLRRDRSEQHERFSLLNPVTDGAGKDLGDRGGRFRDPFGIRLGGSGGPASSAIATRPRPTRELLNLGLALALEYGVASADLKPSTPWTKNRFA